RKGLFPGEREAGEAERSADSGAAPATVIESIRGPRRAPAHRSHCEPCPSPGGSREGATDRSALYAPLVSPETGLASKRDRKSTRLNSSHVKISYAVFCL